MSFRALKYTLTNPANSAILLGVLTLSAFVAFYCPAGWRLLGATLFAGPLLLLVYGTAYRQYRRAEATNQTAALMAWSRAANNPEEQARREELMASGVPLDEILARENVGWAPPLVNGNGLPMIGGIGGVDIAGNLWGATEVSAAVHNPATDDWATPGSAYHSPHNM